MTTIVGVSLRRHNSTYSSAVEQPQRWSWDGDRARLWRDFDATGLAWLHAPETVAAVETDPHATATELLGERPFRLRMRRLEMLPINRRGYENSNIHALFHIDQDPYLPPPIQVLMCVRPASQGGDSTFLDGWELAARLREHDPALYRELFHTPRIIQFSNSHWFGPTLSVRLDNLLVIHGAVPPAADDHVGKAVLSRFVLCRPVKLHMTEGDVIVANNHRLLHGRTAFADPGRLIIRLMIWLERPLTGEPGLLDEARLVAARLEAQLAEQPSWIQHRLGVFGAAGLAGPAFQHDFSRLPDTPDTQSPERYAELAAVLRRLSL